MQQNQQMKVAEASGSRTRIGADSTQDERDASTPNAPNAPNVPPVVHGVPELGRVKPLAWAEEAANCFVAVANGVEYAVVQDPSDGLWHWNFDEDEGADGKTLGGTFLCSSLEDGKAKAEQHWLSTLFGADGPLEPATDATAALTAHVAALRAALESLTNEVAGSLGIAEQAIRDAIGHTNYQCLLRRRMEADEAIAATPEQSLERVRNEAAAEALDEVANLIRQTTPSRTSQYDDYGSGKEDGRYYAVEQIEAEAQRLREAARP